MENVHLFLGVHIYIIYDIYIIEMLTNTDGQHFGAKVFYSSLRASRNGLDASFGIRGIRVPIQPKFSWYLDSRLSLP